VDGLARTPSAALWKGPAAAPMCAGRSDFSRRRERDAGFDPHHAWLASGLTLRDAGYLRPRRRRSSRSRRGRLGGARSLALRSRRKLHAARRRERPARRECQQERERVDGGERRPVLLEAPATARHAGRAWNLARWSVLLGLRRGAVAGRDPRVSRLALVPAGRVAPGAVALVIAGVRLALAVMLTCLRARGEGGGAGQRKRDHHRSEAGRHGGAHCSEHQEPSVHEGRLPQGALATSNAPHVFGTRKELPRNGETEGPLGGVPRRCSVRTRSLASSRGSTEGGRRSCRRRRLRVRVSCPARPPRSTAGSRDSRRLPPTRSFRPREAVGGRRPAACASSSARGSGSAARDRRRPGSPASRP
jgi:hypothetical protein